MFIATLSLVTSIFNGYLNNKFVDMIQRNFGRAEALHTCKEIIDAYSQVKFRTGLARESVKQRPPGDTGRTTAQIDAANALRKFAALGTYLANLNGEKARGAYTDLSDKLTAIVQDAGQLSAEQLEKRFGPADESFARMNDDCVRSAKGS
jgi:hypothetical protein